MVELSISGSDGSSKGISSSLSSDGSISGMY
jgi:hypothetical protein